MIIAAWFFAIIGIQFLILGGALLRKPNYTISGIIFLFVAACDFASAAIFYWVAA